MTADGFMSYDERAQTLTGLLPEVVTWLAEQGRPLRHVVLEGNYGKQVTSTRAWNLFRAENPGLQIHLPTTGRNKTDPVVGVQALLPGLYRTGMKRIPRSRENIDGLNLVRQLALELTTFPRGRTSDLVMRDWLFEQTVEDIIKAELLSTGPARVSTGPMPQHLRRQMVEVQMRFPEKEAAPAPCADGRILCELCGGEGGFYENDFDDDEGHTVYRECRGCFGEGEVVVWKKGQVA
jgi:hypothetical protein